MSGGTTIMQQPQVPPHGEVEQLVPMKLVRGDQVDDHVNGELEPGEHADHADRQRRSTVPADWRGQASATRSFSTHTFIAKKSRIMAA